MFSLDSETKLVYLRSFSFKKKLSSDLFKSMHRFCELYNTNKKLVEDLTINKSSPY